MRFPRIASKRERRARLFGALFAVATALVAFGFFQGFETDTSGWFPFGLAVVTSVLQPSAPADYNGNGTSYYGNNDKTTINAASGTHLGRVTSAVSVGSTAGEGSCTIDTSGPGPASSLLCNGPYTLFGLPRPLDFPFPTGGYTTKQDIYLDVGYANNHPDCGTANPVGAPCTPKTPGTVNPACITNPNGIDCEGSRFTWTVGLNDPSGNFHRDYVFQVGTAPDPSGVFGGCTSGGYVINTQYNSFRSGGYPYDPNWQPLCIPTSGWYTFKQVFSNDGADHLKVVWSIADSGGSIHVCQDTTGTTVDCTWTRTDTVNDPIDEIGCPRYGWLANEEINDLAIDNTELDIAAGACGTASATAQITPTDTTCTQFNDGSAQTLSQLLYTLKGKNIASVSPGVFFYYTKLTGTEGNSVFISQTHSKTPPGNISILQSQAILYSSTCAKVGSLTDNGNGTATGTLPTDGTFIIGVKYNPSSLKGQPGPTPTGSTSTYTFDTTVDSTELVTATIDLKKK